MLVLPLVLISNAQPSRMTHSYYPNDMSLLAIVRMCQTPVAISWHSSLGVYNDVIQIDTENYKKLFLNNISLETLGFWVFKTWLIC